VSSGATPVLITSDNQVNALEKKGVLTERPGNAVLNCPILRVINGSSQHTLERPIGTTTERVTSTHMSRSTVFSGR
jgi:hypothetical protein